MEFLEITPADGLTGSKPIMFRGSAITWFKQDDTSPEFVIVVLASVEEPLGLRATDANAARQIYNKIKEAL